MLSEKVRFVTSSTDFKPLQLDPRIIRFKDFSFEVGPTSATVREDSRTAEYRYLFTDGVETTKVRGNTTITLEGIAIPNSLKRGIATIAGAVEGRSNLADNFGNLPPQFEKDYGNFAQTAAQNFYEWMRRLADGTYGVLVTPGLGTFSNALLTSYSFTEDGDNPRQLNYSLEFVASVPVPPVIKQIPKDIQDPSTVPDVDSQNVEYTIVRGDTLSAIAKRFGVTLSQLKVQNPQLFDAKHRNGNLIFPGEKVKIQKSTAYTETPTDHTKTNKATVNNLNKVPRDERAKVVVVNKGKPLNTKQPNAKVENIPTNKVESYTQVAAASKILGVLPCEIPVPPTIIRNPTSLEKAAIGQRNAISQLFPIFSGIVSYGDKSKINSTPVKK